MRRENYHILLMTKTIQYKNRAYSRILRDNRNITKYKEGL